MAQRGAASSSHRTRGQLHFEDVPSGYTKTTNRHLTSSKRIRRSMGSGNAPPAHVHTGDWRDMMMTITKICGDEDFVRCGSDGQLQRELQEEKPPIDKIETMTVSNSMDTIRSAVPALISGRKRAPSEGSEQQNEWIMDAFEKRDCAYFVPTTKDPEKCGCGRWRTNHTPYALEGAAGAAPMVRYGRDTRWAISKHTITQPTDAFGTIEFQGGPHPYKAQYVRLAFDTDPARIMDLFQHIWKIPPPKLIITVHGGISNFNLQAKLSRVFRKGLLKAAATTGAWIITSGINAGVVKYVSAALDGAMNILGHKRKVRITCIGIAPWGLLKKRDDFVGEDKVVSYHPHSFSPKGRFAVLNNRHSYYLLVDNGSIGRYGADIILRRRLEGYIVKKQKIDGSERSVPVVCVLLEGGTCTIRTVLDYVTNSPRVPVVICDGSGRASDLLAFAHECVTAEGGQMSDTVRVQMLNLIKKVFGYDSGNAEHLLLDILACVRQKQLITVFRLGENPKNDVDYAILSALLKGHELSPSEQLALALAWNRVDIARNDVFGNGSQDVPLSALHDSMMEALIHNRVDFVKLLLEHGVSMCKFLTIERLEALYNTEHGPPNTLYYIVRDVVRITSNYRYTLSHIGLAIEKLMGSGYRSYYTSSAFRKIYDEYRRHYLSKINRSSFMANSGALSSVDYLSGPLAAIAAGINPIEDANVIAKAPSGNRALSSHLMWRSALRRDNLITPALMGNASMKDMSHVDIDDDGSYDAHERDEYHFKYPFSDLLIWAVLTKRHDMALCLWDHGEEALAKALVACRLYKSLSKEAAEDYLEVEICDELRQYADEFRQLSLELLDCCYKFDDTQTLQLLTYELAYWGNETCLSLAVMVNNKAFLAHPCCQILLADLWHGGLRIRSNSNLKVIMGIIFPLSILLLEFKSREELQKQPQTAAEHEDELNDSTSSSSDSDSDTSSDSDSSEFDNLEPHNRRVSASSSASAQFPYIFQSKRRRRIATKTEDMHQPIELRVTNPEGYNRSGVPGDSALPIQFPNGGRPESETGHKHRRRLRTLSKHKDSGLGITTPVIAGLANGGCMSPGEDTLKSRRRSTKVSPEPVSVLKTKLLPNTIIGSRKIKIRRRFYEFFAAPITTFWAWTLSYVVFMCALIYVLLIRTPLYPSIPEWFLFSYVMSMFIESVRKLLMAEPTRLSEKFAFFFVRHWNTFTTVTILSFLIGFAFRVIDYDDPSNGRCILAVSSVLWSIKLLDFLSVHPKFGPLVTMASKMILNMAYVVIMLAISLLSFGLARQSITYPNEDFHWILVRNIFYKPYFMLYGEVYADEIDQCGDELWDGHLENGTYGDEFEDGSTSCVPGHWIPPLLMTVFLLIANLLLISMLIAIFNNIFDATNRISQQIWLFQRYFQVMEYEATPFPPPPFTLIYHVYMLLKYAHHRLLIRFGKRRADRKSPFDFSLKLFLDPDQVEKVHDFEEECVDEYMRSKEYAKTRSNEERLQRIADRTDAVLSRINDVSVRDCNIKADVDHLESRIDVIEGRQDEMLECLRQITTALPVILASVQQKQTPPLPHQRQHRPSGGSHQPARAESFPKTDSNKSRNIDDAEADNDDDDDDDDEDDDEVTIQVQPIPVPGRSATSQSDQRFVAGRSMDELIPTILDAKRLQPGSAGAGELGRLQHGQSPSKATLFGSILSLEKTPKPSSSMRRRRHHDEYTSITDAIDLGTVVVVRAETEPVPEVAEDEDDRNRTEIEDNVEEDDFDMAQGFSESEDTLMTSQLNSPSVTLSRGIDERQNIIFKEYEEAVGRQIGSRVPPGAESSKQGSSNDEKTSIGSQDYIEFRAPALVVHAPSTSVDAAEQEHPTASSSLPATPSPQGSPTKQPLLQKQLTDDAIVRPFSPLHREDSSSDKSSNEFDRIAKSL